VSPAEAGVKKKAVGTAQLKLRPFNAAFVGGSGAWRSATFFSLNSHP